MENPQADKSLVEPILLGVTELVDKHEWVMAVDKSPKLPSLVRKAIRACLLNEQPVETVHTTVARALMNTEFSVKIVGRRLEEFFYRTFGIPPLHSQSHQQEASDVLRNRNEEAPKVDPWDDDEHEEIHSFPFYDDDFDDTLEYEDEELAA